METLDELRTRVERSLRQIAAIAAAAPDPDREPVPFVRRELIMAARLRTALRNDISLGSQVLTKAARRVEKQRDTHALILRMVATCKERAATADAYNGEQQAWLLGPQYLGGEVTGDVPGAVIALCREHGINHVPPLPTCDEMLAQAEADLKPVVERLQSALDKWDATVRVTGTSHAVLPAPEGHAVAHVRERSTT